MRRWIMSTYIIVKDGDVLRMSFGQPGSNDMIVRDAVAAIKSLRLEGGKLIRLNGPASLPVAVAIAHEIGHIFGVIAVFDPKLGKYVVAISHNPEYLVGSLID
jgi:CRISPR-associated protein Csx3